jgi:hypothetical protein
LTRSTARRFGRIRLKPPKRAAFAGIIHAIGGGEEALPEDLAAMFGLYRDLAPEEVEAMWRSQVDAELSGEDSWAGLLARSLSVHHMCRVAAAASFDHLQRAIQVVSDIALWQSMVVLFGLLDLAGKPFKTGSELDRFDGVMIRQLQSDPMWPEVNAQRLSTKPRHTVRHLVVSALGLLISGRLPAWEAYRDRLVQLAHPPHLHETEPVLRGNAEYAR